MSPAPTAVSTALSIDARAPVGGSLYGDGNSEISEQESGRAIAANNAMIGSLSEAGFTNCSARHGLDLCNSLYPYYHNRAEGEQSPSEATNFMEGRLTLHKLNTNCIQVGKDLLENQDGTMHGDFMKIYEAELLDAKPSYIANETLAAHMDDLHDTDEGHNNAFSRYAQQLRSCNLALKSLHNAKLKDGANWGKAEQEFPHQCFNDFIVVSEELHAEIGTYMDTVKAQSEEMTASECGEANLQDWGQAN